MELPGMKKEPEESWMEEELAGLKEKLKLALADRTAEVEVEGRWTPPFSLPEPVAAAAALVDRRAGVVPAAVVQARSSEAPFGRACSRRGKALGVHFHRRLRCLCRCRRRVRCCRPRCCRGHGQTAALLPPPSPPSASSLVWIARRRRRRRRADRDLSKRRKNEKIATFAFQRRWVMGKEMSRKKRKKGEA